MRARQTCPIQVHSEQIEGGDDAGVREGKLNGERGDANMDDWPGMRQGVWRKGRRPIL